MDFPQLFFGFEGRLRRRDYWLATFGLGVVMLIGRALLTGALRMPFLDPRMSWLVIVTVWPSTALMVKRLHDRDLSGWWSALLWASSAGSMIKLYVSTLSGSTVVALGVATAVISIGGLIVLGFLDGTKGPNRYGASPKGIGGPHVTVAQVFD